MKAWVLYGINDFRLETIEIPKLKKDEVLVSVKAAGICGSDIPRVYQTGAYFYPLILGHECSGIVEEVEEETDKKWKGKRVGIYPLIPCMDCIPCQRQQYEMCRNYSYLGSRRNGGFAEYLAVPAKNLVELPSTVSYEEAAMLEPMAVAVHAIRKVLFCTVRGTKKIVICGLGTIGLLLFMFLWDIKQQNSQYGIQILVIGNKEFQKQRVLKMGLSEEDYCDGRVEDIGNWIMERTEGMGADIFFECVGKNETFTEAVDFTAPAGSICLVGNPYSDMRLEKAVYWKILRNQLTITGTWNSSFLHNSEDDWHYILKRLEQKKIEPCQFISHQFAIEELEKGFQIMRDKTEEYVKIMMMLKFRKDASIGRKACTGFACA